MQINRIWAAMIATAMLVHAAAAQETGIKRVGVILQGGPWYAVVAGLREGLNQAGYLEGKRYVLDIRDTHGDLKAAEEAARSLEEQKVDLIYTAASSVSLAAKRGTRRTPIVFYAGTDPVVTKLVESIRRPGGRLTGVYTRVTEVTGKRLELLREIVPNLHRVVTFYNPANLAALEAAKEAREAAQNLGLELSERLVTSVDELRKALQGFRSGEADAYFAASDAMLDEEAHSVIEMVKANRLPSMFYVTSLPLGALPATAQTSEKVDGCPQLMFCEYLKVQIQRTCQLNRATDLSS